jgi:hypothetical protein
VAVEGRGVRLWNATTAASVTAYKAAAVAESEHRGERRPPKKNTVYQHTYLTQSQSHKNQTISAMISTGLGSSIQLDLGALLHVGGRPNHAIL